MVLTIFKMIVTSSFLTALECTTFVFDRVSARTPCTEGADRDRRRGEERKVRHRPFANSCIRP